MANLWSDNQSNLDLRRQSICRLCYIGAPLSWMMGTFYVGIEASHVYATITDADVITYVVILGLFSLLCAIFTTSNIIHYCLHLPTSPAIARIQKAGQILMAVLFTIIYTLTLFAYLSASAYMDNEAKGMLYTFLLKTAFIYVVLSLSAVSCLLG